MKLTILIAIFAAVACAQDKKGPLVATSQGMFAIAKNDVNRSMAKIPDEVWNFQPAPTVRTIGQLFAHIADGQYEFCGQANGEQINKDVEKNAKTKDAIMTAVRDAFAYCDAVYAKMTDSSASAMVSFFGQKMTMLGVMDFNIAHTMEHYGNLTTYMRMNGIVPPSSEGGK